MDKQAVNVWIDCGGWGHGSRAACVIKVMNIWVEHCSLWDEMIGSRHFEGTCCLNSEWSSWSIWPLRMKLMRFFDTSVNTHRKTRCCISETRNSPLRRWGNLKLHLLWVPQRLRMYCNCLGNSQMLSTHFGPSVGCCLTCCMAVYPAGGQQLCRASYLAVRHI